MNTFSKISFVSLPLLLTISVGAEVIDPQLPNLNISKVGNILAYAKDPQQLKIYSQFKTDSLYTRDVLYAFNQAGMSLKTTTGNLKGRPSIDFKPIESLVFQQLPASHRHPWNLAVKSGILGAVTMLGAMKANEAGYFNLIKNKFNKLVTKFFKR